MVINREILEDREQSRVHPADLVAVFHRLELVRSYGSRAHVLFVQSRDGVVEAPEKEQLCAFVGVRGVVLLRENLHVFCHLNGTNSERQTTSVEYFCPHR